MPQSEFALRTGMTIKNLSTLINGKSNITFEVAEKLSRFFGNRIDFWTNLQDNYDLFLRKEAIEKEYENDWKIVRLLNKDFLRRVCFIEISEQSKTDIIDELRTTLMVSCLSNLKNVEMFALFKAAGSYRNNETQTVLRNAWISLAMKKAMDLTCGKYDTEKLLKMLPDLKRLTMLPPEEFTPLLQAKLSDAGIRYVELPYLEGSGIRGMSKWIPGEECVVMAINDCDRISDRIWFTIFHELGHVIKNHKRHFVVSLDNDESTEEKEADLFARNTLIDPKHLQAFVSKGAFDLDSICHFAEQEGISKDIIIGRLENDHVIDPDLYDVFKNNFGV